MSLGAPVGTHLLINVYDITNEEILIHLQSGLPLLDRIVRQLGLHIVAQTGHQFHPFGYSYAYVLSESHFTIHTYPEHKSCYIDVFCCNPAFDPAFAVRVIQDAFHTETVRYQVVQR